MTQHIFESTYKGKKVQVTLGFDREHRRYFMHIHDVECAFMGLRLEPSAGPKDSVEIQEQFDPEDDAPTENCDGIIYASEFDARARPTDIGFFRDALERCDIEIPEVMYEAVQADRILGYGDRYVVYHANGAIDRFDKDPNLRPL